MSFKLEVRSYSGGGRHVHAFSQILIPVRGAMRLDIEGAAATLSGHCVAVVPPEHVHLFEPTADCKLLVIDVVGSDLPKDRVPEHPDLRIPTAEEELEAMRSAGYDAQIVYRSFNTAVFMGRKN